MKEKTSIFLNIFYYKIIALLVFISATTKYTSFIYDYGIYFIVVYGCFLFVYNIVRRNFIYRKIDISLILFAICYCVTILINCESGILKQVFVLMCCLMYFFTFFSSDTLSMERFRKENNVMLLIVVVFSFITANVSLWVFAYDLLTGGNATYNLHEGNLFQFIGAYSGIATLAIISGLSAICSLYFIVCRTSVKDNKKFFIFNVINFLIQDFMLTLAFTSAGVVTFGTALFIGTLGYLLKKFDTRLKRRYVVAVIMSLCIVALNYVIMDKTANEFVDAFSGIIAGNIEEENYGNNADDGSINIEADNATKELTTSNGRAPIWESAIEQWKDKPVFGIGYGNFYYKMPIEKQGYIEYSNMHSGYIELLVTCGVIGFVCIIVFGGYYIFNLIKHFLKDKRYYNEIGIIMIIIYACMYALINQLFILDRSISVFLLCTFLGMSRKMLTNDICKLHKEKKYE